MVAWTAESFTVRTSLLPTVSGRGRDLSRFAHVGLRDPGDPDRRRFRRAVDPEMARRRPARDLSVRRLRGRMPPRQCDGRLRRRGFYIFSEFPRTGLLQHRAHSVGHDWPCRVGRVVVADVRHRTRDRRDPPNACDYPRRGLGDLTARLRLHGGVWRPDSHSARILAARLNSLSESDQALEPEAGMGIRNALVELVSGTVLSGIEFSHSAVSDAMRRKARELGSVESPGRGRVARRGRCCTRAFGEIASSAFDQRDETYGASSARRGSSVPVRTSSPVTSRCSGLRCGGGSRMPVPSVASSAGSPE